MIPHEYAYRHLKYQKISLVYQVKPRCHIANRQLKCMASKEFNSLPKDVTQKLTHGEFKMNSTILKCVPTRKVI